MVALAVYQHAASPRRGDPVPRRYELLFGKSAAHIIRGLTRARHFSRNLAVHHLQSQHFALPHREPVFVQPKAHRRDFHLGVFPSVRELSLGMFVVL